MLMGAYDPRIVVSAIVTAAVVLVGALQTALTPRRRAAQAALAAERTELLAREQEARGAAERATARLQAVLDVLPIGVIIADATGRLLQANAAARDLWGETPLVTGVEEYRAYRGWWPDTGRPIAPEEWTMARALTTGEVCAGEEVEIETFDGERKTMLNHGAPIRDDAGRIAGAVVAVLDMTDRKRLERRTHEALDALLAMAEALVQGEGDAASADEDTEDAAARTTTVAQRLVALTCSVLGCRRVSITAVDPATGASRPVAAIGITAEEERAWRSSRPGASLREYLDAAHMERLQRDDVLVIDADDLPEGALPYGARALLLASMRVGPNTVGILSLDHGGAAHTYTPDERALARAVAKLVALVIERERLLRERAEAQSSALALSEANRRMDAFLALASHELKTPLTSVAGNIQIAERRLRRAMEQDSALATDVAPLLERARRNLSRMDQLVDDLLDMSRIQAERLELTTEPVDLVALVRDIVDEQRPPDLARTILLDLPEAQVVAQTDPERVEQVILNYLTNAIKYAPPEQPIEVGVRVEARQARVWVRDEGPGLAARDQERVWERFHRVEGIEHRAGSRVGLGLGLYISRTIVERLGGQVGVESIPGEGATFWFTLPLNT